MCTARSAWGRPDFGLAASNDVPAVRDGVIAVGVVAFVALIAVQLVVRQTFAVALYRYATTNATQGPFQEHDMRSPFRRNRSSSV
jgi:hypothetical protein